MSGCQETQLRAVERQIVKIELHLLGRHWCSSAVPWPRTIQIPRSQAKRQRPLSVGLQRPSRCLAPISVCPRCWIWLDRQLATGPEARAKTKTTKNDRSGNSDGFWRQ